MIQKINDQKSHLAKLIFFQYETKFLVFSILLTYIMLSREWIVPQKNNPLRLHLQFYKNKMI